MLKTIIKKGSYHDSIVLMLLTNALSGLEGVKRVSVMMATPANKDIFRQGGFETTELLEAAANDMVIVAEAEAEEVFDVLLEKTEEFLAGQSKKTGKEAGEESVKSWEKADKASRG